MKSSDNGERQPFFHSIPRLTLFAGLILVILAGIVLTVFYLIERSSSKNARQEDNFYRILREYDDSISVFYATEREYDHLNSTLDRLEKTAISVESWLSILKRRNYLSKNHRNSLANYHKSINSALTAYPFSEPITAIAAAALVKDAAINSEKENQLRLWLPMLADPAYNSLRLSLHVLLGDFKNLSSASVITSDIVSDGTESITVDLAILKILRKDYRAAADIQLMLETSLRGLETSLRGLETINDDPNQSAIVKTPLSDNALTFAAEYYYDFGDLFRSAEVFSLINNPSAMARQADAMYLADLYDSAKAIWNILANENNLQVKEKQNEIALYNLSVLALKEKDLIQAEDYLKKLQEIDADPNSSNNIKQSRQFGLILFSRLQELPKAISLLYNTNNLQPRNFPYIDLEINKRNAVAWNLGRQVAETWLLLDRHPETIDLYEWAGWHLFFQRRYDEIPILLDRFNMLKFDNAWASVYKAIYLMNDGNLQEAENILLSVPLNETEWFVFANLGRIYEEIRSLPRAVIQYEQASSILQQNPSVQNNKISSKIMQRIAKCLIVQNKASDALRALLSAVELDPDNITARHELDRMLY